MRSVEVVEVLPFLKPIVEEVGVVYDDAVEHAVELFLVDAVGALNLAVESRSCGSDVDVTDAGIQDVIVESGLELGAVVGLDDLDAEREFLKDVVEEPDRRVLVAAVVDPQYPDAGAVVDGGVLVVLGPGRALSAQELDVDLHAMAGLGLLVPFPPLFGGFVPLGGGKPIHVEAFEDPPHPRRTDRDVVISLEIHGDLVRPEVVVLAQIHDLADDLGAGLVW